ncbi:extracellular solute-binding protein [Treponema sp.]|uniref:extracellular solute-binding protein n=1 Tax=Treponema sp. TaxID=166 RepID=UPI0025F3BBBE|nr:extracellular solute-binding protein [Treponema sp.]MCR5219023.1 ABC transporter substrate-binding protein [Treponema sp.]
MKRVFVVIMALVSVLITSCGNKNAQEKVYTAEENRLIKTGWYNDYSEHVKIVYLTLGNPPSNGATGEMLNKLNSILTEKVNAELEIMYIPWNDYLNEYNRLLARKNGKIDLIGTATDWLDAWKNAKLGNLAVLSDENLKKYAGQTYSQVASKGHWDQCKYQGKIYLIPEDNYAQWINHGFMYRNDWAKEAGLKGVHSWNDLTKYFSYLLKQNKPNFYPWDAKGATDIAGGYILSNSDFMVLDGVNAYGLFGVHKADMTKIYSPYTEGKELVNFAKLMKRWNDMGVWRKNVLTANPDNRTAFYTGKSGVEQHHTQTWYTQVKGEMDKRFPGSDVGFFWFGEETGNITTMGITHGAMAISSASKHKARALAVYDLLRNDPECYRLLCNGIEGKQYEISRGRDGNNYAVKPAGYNGDRDGIVTNFWWGRNDNLELRDASGSWDSFEEINKLYTSLQTVYPFGEIVWNLDYVNWEIIKLTAVCDKYMKNITYGQMDNPEAYVREFRAELKKYGIDTVIAELQEQLDDYYAERRR